MIEPTQNGWKLGLKGVVNGKSSTSHKTGVAKRILSKIILLQVLVSQLIPLDFRFDLSCKLSVKLKKFKSR